MRNQIGRLHFLKREFTEAIVELEKTLAVDPEDLEAHYQLDARLPREWRHRARQASTASSI